MRSLIPLLTLLLLAACTTGPAEKVQVEINAFSSACEQEVCTQYAIVGYESAWLAIPLGTITNTTPAEQRNLTQGENLTVEVVAEDPARLLWEGAGSEFVRPMNSEDGERLCRVYHYQSIPAIFGVSFCDNLLLEQFEQEPWEAFPEYACEGALDEDCLLRHALAIPDRPAKKQICDTFPESAGDAGRHCYGEYLEEAMKQGFPDRDRFCANTTHPRWCLDAYYFYAPACGLIEAEWLSRSCSVANANSYDRARSFNNQCLFRLRDGDAQLALGDCNKAVEVDGEQAYIWESKGQVHEALNQTDEAIAAYERAVELQPALFTAQIRLARLTATIK